MTTLAEGLRHVLKGGPLVPAWTAWSSLALSFQRCLWSNLLPASGHLHPVQELRWLLLQNFPKTKQTSLQIVVETSWLGDSTTEDMQNWKMHNDEQKEKHPGFWFVDSELLIIAQFFQEWWAAQSKNLGNVREKQTRKYNYCTVTSWTLLAL